VSTPLPIPSGQPAGVTTTVVLPAILAVAKKYQLRIVPLYDAFLNQPQLYKDSTHPTDGPGLQTIADAVYATMTGAAAAPGDGGPGDGDGGGGGREDASTPGDAGRGADDASAGGTLADDGGGPLDAGGAATSAEEAGPPAGESGAGSGDPESPGRAASSSGCACAVTGTGGRPGGVLGLLLSLAAICLWTDRRRRGR
jgi:hypothetical protein